MDEENRYPDSIMEICQLLAKTDDSQLIFDFFESINSILDP